MTEWYYINQFIFLALMLLVAKIVKEKIPIFKKVIVPTALLAGMFGLVFSTQLLGSLIPNSNTFTQLKSFLTVNNTFFVNVIYHALGIGFIAMALKHSDKKMSANAKKTGLVIVMTYLVQGVVGFSISIFIFSFINNSFFSGAGLLLPLGFGQGPGMASSIGNSEAWEKFFISGGGVSFGQAVATIGFLWGGIIGVILLNYYIRKYKIQITSKDKKKIFKKQHEFQTTEQVRFLDSLTVQAVIILVVYLMSYITIELGSLYLTLIDGNKDAGFEHDLAGLIKSFNYLFGIIYALLLKKILSWFDKRGHRTRFATNNYLLSNITSLMFNIMITASIISISLTVVKEYWFEIVVITSLGGVATLVFLKLVINRFFKQNVVEYTISLFGMLTGTISTGIGLLKTLDTEYESEVPENLVVGSAYALLFAFPLLAVLSFPVASQTKGNPLINYLGLLILITYLLILLIISNIIFKNKNKK